MEQAWSRTGRTHKHGAVYFFRWVCATELLLACVCEWVATTEKHSQHGSVIDWFLRQRYGFRRRRRTTPHHWGIHRAWVQRAQHALKRHCCHFVLASRVLYRHRRWLSRNNPLGHSGISECPIRTATVSRHWISTGRAAFLYSANFYWEWIRWRTPIFGIWFLVCFDMFPASFWRGIECIWALRLTARWKSGQWRVFGLYLLLRNWAWNHVRRILDCCKKSHLLLISGVSLPGKGIVFCKSNSKIRQNSIYICER